MLYDPNDVMRMVEPEWTDQWGNRRVMYLDHDGWMIEITQLASGGRRYSASEPQGDRYVNQNS